MRKLGFLALLLVALGLAYILLDFAAKGFVETRVEEEFGDRERLQVERVVFSVDSFPFLIRLAGFGEVSASLRLEEIEERGVTIDGFDLDVDGLVFDRLSAFAGDVQVTDLDQATASIALGEESLSVLIGAPVRIATDGAVTADGIGVEAVVRGGSLVLAAEGVGSTTVPIRVSRYLPCEPEVAVVDRLVTLTCVTEVLPPIVNQVLGQAAGRRG